MLTQISGSCCGSLSTVKVLCPREAAIFEKDLVPQKSSTVVMSAPSRKKANDHSESKGETDKDGDIAVSDLGM